MIQSKIIRKENKLVCANNHQNEQIIFILQKKDLKVQQRLLCQLCTQDLDSPENMISFQKVTRVIEEQQEKLSDYLNEIVKKTTDNILLFKQSIDLLKTNIIQKLDQLTGSTELWMNGLLDISKQGQCYSLLEQFENLDQSLEEKQLQQNKVLEQCNYSCFKNIELLFKNTTFREDLHTCQQNFFGIFKENYIKDRITLVNGIIVEKQGAYDTPKIGAQYCSIHQSEIVDICILKGIKKEERLRCIQCKRNNSIPIGEFEKLWKRYQEFKMQEIQKYKTKLIAKSEKVKELLSSLMLNQQKCMKQLIDKIDQSKKFNENIPLINEKRLKSSSESDLVLEMAEELSQVEENKQTQVQLVFEEEWQRANQNVSKQLQELIDSFQITYKTITQQFTEDLSQQDNTKENQESFKINETITPQNKISYELTDDKVKQQELCHAVAFNREGSIMVAGYNYQIKVWRLDNGQLKEQLRVLHGHTGNVYCFVFSKKVNWFASGSLDQTIRCWKDIGNNEWKGSQPQKVHPTSVLCILLNQNEDQLISSSYDISIKIWIVDQQNNEITYEYSLDKHTSIVYCISLNESETTLVSCSDDKQILIWGRGENRKWEYKYPITKSADDFGYRICFINDNMIAWQQQGQGFTHIFKFENNKFIEKQELKIELKQVGSDGCSLFPSVFYKQKQVLIQKHNMYVYIIRVSNDGEQFKIQQEPIYCNNNWNFGGLTANGQHLVIWDAATTSFRLYKLKYE